MAMLALRVGKLPSELRGETLPDLLALLAAAGLTGELLRLSEPERAQHADSKISSIIAAAKQRVPPRG